MLFAKALAEPDSWFISGSLCGSGDSFLSQFELVVFLLMSTKERLARLRAREVMRYGHEALAAGGRLHKAHIEFLDWAQRYDDEGLNMRSSALHEPWIQRIALPVVRLDGNKSVHTLLGDIESAAAQTNYGRFIEIDENR